MIVLHGETLWSPAPQPMDDDDDRFPGFPVSEILRLQLIIIYIDSDNSIRVCDIDARCYLFIIQGHSNGFVVE